MISPKTAVGILVLVATAVVIYALPDRGPWLESQVATTTANQEVEVMALTPTPTPFPTPNMAICLLPPPDKKVVISESVPTAWNAFEVCFKECIEANGADSTNFAWWLQQNGFTTVESADIVHIGDQFDCISKPGWWSK